MAQRPLSPLLDEEERRRRRRANAEARERGLELPFPDEAEAVPEPAPPAFGVSGSLAEAERRRTGRVQTGGLAEAERRRTEEPPIPEPIAPISPTIAEEALGRAPSEAGRIPPGLPEEEVAAFRNLDIFLERESRKDFPSPEFIDLGNIVDSVFPVTDLTPEGIRTAVFDSFVFAMTDTESFVKVIQGRGRSTETEAILELFYPGITTEDMDNLFTPGIISSAEVEGISAPLPPQFDTQESREPGGFFDELSRSIQLGAKEFAYNTEQYFTDVIIPRSWPEYGVTAPIPPQLRDSPDQVAHLNRVHKAQRDKSRQVAADNREKHEDWLEKHPDLQPPADYERQVKVWPPENLDLLKDPGYWGMTIGSSATYSLAVMGASAGVFYTTRNPMAAIAAGTAMATPAASKDVFDDALSAGASEDDAAAAALVGGVFIAGIESVTNLPLLSAIDPAFKVFKKPIQKAAMNKGVAWMAKNRVQKGVQKAATISIVEGLEEVAQGATQNAIVKIFDENREIFQDVQTTIIQTVIATAPFAIFGAGMEIRHVNQEVAASVSDQEKAAEGWVQDDITAEWYKPERMVDTYNNLVTDFKDQGLDDQQARVKALNELARTPAGEKAIADFVAKEFPVKGAAEEVSPEQRDLINKLDAQKRVLLKRFKDVSPEESTTQILDEIAEIDRQIAEIKAAPEAVPAVAEAPEVVEPAVVVTPQEVELLNLLSPETPINIDELATQAGISITDASARLTALELRGEVKQVSGGNYIRTAPPVAPTAPVAKKPAPKPPTVPKAPEARAPEKPKKRVTKVPVPKAQEVEPPPPSSIDITPEQTTAVLNLFSNALIDPATASQREATLEWRKLERAKRAKNMQSRIEELITEGIREEAAIKQAEQETMSKTLPGLTTDAFEEMTLGMRDALFAKVYEVLRDEPFELMSTHEALTNALMGKSIPREPGTKGGSAYSRLLRVFGDQPQIMEVLDQEKTLEDSIKSVFAETGGDPVQLDQEWLDYIRSLPPVPLAKEGFAEWQGLLFGSTDPTVQEIGRTYEERRQGLWAEELKPPSIEDRRSEAEKTFSQRKLELGIELDEGRISQDLYDIEILIEKNKVRPHPPIPPQKPPINDAVNQMDMWPNPAKDAIIRVLKEIGWSPIDIGNFMRANKASFDFSFWRQQGPMILNHKVDFMMANIEAWKAIWSQKSAEASWSRITRDPLFQIYEEAAAQGHDFLRPLELAKGTAQWRGIEEFGFLTGERLIPRLTMKIPHVRISARAFATGTNEHNFRMFKDFYNATLQVNEKISSGEIKLKPGESFSIEKEMMDYAKMLADFTQRASLGKAAGLAPTLNSLIFAPRATLGRLLTPRHLLSANPRIRKEAFNNLVTWITGMGAIVLLGNMLDLWEVEKDPRSGEYMSVRIGNTRVDPWSGYRQFLVFFTRVFKGTGISSVTGAEYEIDPIRAMTSFVRGKASPLAAIMLDFWTGRNFIGEEVDVKNKKQWAERVAPFAVWDIYEAVFENPFVGAVISVPAFVGAGVQTYTGDWRENIPKLGLPKYSDNPTYNIDEPMYDVRDFWADHGGEFKGVDPETLTPQKGFPSLIKALAESKAIVEDTKDITKVKLTSINADPEKGNTFIEYYEQWRERRKITDEKELKEFDERNPDAHLGNFTPREFSLLKKFHGMSEERQRKWIKDNPEDAAEITQNPYTEWLRDNPEENARLAAFGQAKVLTQEAYDMARGFAKKWGIPEEAINEYLPPKKVAKSHFEYEAAVGEFGGGSSQAQLVLAQDRDFRIWKGLDLPDTPVPSLEISVAWEDADKEWDSILERYRDVEDEKEKDRLIEAARTKLFEANEGYQEDRWRRDAYNAGFLQVDEFVERAKLVEEFSPGSAEAKLFMLDNPDFLAEGLRLERWTDDLSDESIQNLQIIARWRDVDAAYDKIDKEDAEAVKAFKKKHPKWVDDNRRKEAYGWNKDLKTSIVAAHVKHGNLSDEFSPNSAEVMLARFDDKTGYEAMRTDPKNKDEDFYLKPVDESRVPIWRIDARYRRQDEQYEAIQFDDATEQREKRERYLRANTAYARARREREAYQLGFAPSVGFGRKPGLFEKYVEFALKPQKGMERELFLKENLALAKKLEITVSERPVESLRLSVKWQDHTDEFDGFSTFGARNYISDPIKRDEARYNFLYVKNRKYARARREIDAWNLGVPKNLIEAFADYYMIIGTGKPESEAPSTIFFVDNRFLREHKKYYEDVYLGMLHRDPVDFDRIPSKEFEAFYNKNYATIFGEDRESRNEAARDRYALRGRTPWFDAEGVRIGFWKPWKRPSGAAGPGVRLI